MMTLLSYPEPTFDSVSSCCDLQKCQARWVRVFHITPSNQHLFYASLTLSDRT